MLSKVKFAMQPLFGRTDLNLLTPRAFRAVTPIDFTIPVPSITLCR